MNRNIGTEPDTETLKARAACTDVINATYRLVDEKRATSSMPLFTEDAVLELNGNALSIAAAMSSRDADDVDRLRIPAQIDFWMETPDRAHAVTLLHVYHFGPDPKVIPPPHALARVEDMLVRSADGVWRVSCRRVSVLAGE